MKLIGIMINVEINNVVIISLFESADCPCSDRNLVREEFNPKFVNRFRFPITETSANTPYCSVPNSLIKMGIHKKVSVAVIIS